MRKVNNYWLHCLCLVGGALICYITMQISFFNIDEKVNVVEVLISIGTAIIGLYIAHTIQKNITKSQNKYTYLETKIDIVWVAFGTFSQVFSYSDTIEGSSFKRLQTEIIPPVSILKDLFNSFDVPNQCINELETKLNLFEEYISNLRSIENNVIDFSQNKIEIDTQIKEINICFTRIVQKIQDL
jgi:hypothetical protein